MIVSNSRQFIFVHVPKCAGSTIANLLFPYVRWNDIELGVSEYGEAIQQNYEQRFGLWKHSRAVEIRNVVGECVFDTYFKFAFVRHPASRVISFYTFIKKLSLSPSPAAQAMLGTWPIAAALRESGDFSGFIRHPGFVEPPMCDFLAPPSPRESDQPQLVDFIGKVETLERDVATIFKRIGLPAPEIIRHHNRSSEAAPRLSTFYRSEDDILFVHDKYRTDFECFGYTLDDTIRAFRRGD